MMRILVFAVPRDCFEPTHEVLAEEGGPKSTPYVFSWEDEHV
jgi:hypothetical protein